MSTNPDTVRRAANDAVMAFERDRDTHGALRIRLAEDSMPAATAVLLARQTELISALTEKLDELTTSVQALGINLGNELTLIRESIDLLPAGTGAAS